MLKPGHRSQTSLSLRPDERAALRRLSEMFGLPAARVVGLIVLAVAHTVDAGGPYPTILDAIAGIVEAGALRGTAEALMSAYLSPTADQSVSVMGDATDRPTDRPCGGYA